MLQPGERIDEWIVDGPLGTGGTASVYRVHNAKAERIRAALKVLDPAALTQPEARARLAREGEVLHGLEHRAIVRVHGVRPAAAPPYLVMELVEGDKLATRLHERGATELAEALPMLDALADAVAYLHHRGIQHRDIKPQNVLLRDDGSPVLVDFGLVLEAGASRLTADGLRMGTVSYVPPEWADPANNDPVRWDVYSLGTVFWEILVGRRAFPLSDDQHPNQAALQVMREKRTHPPLDPGPDVPFYLRVLIRDMTHPDPDRRPDDAGEVLARLREGESGGELDPVDLFRTPMPAWQAEQGSAGPTLDTLSSSSVPLAPEQVATGAPRGWWRSFVVGLIFGAVLVSLTFAAIGVGYLMGATSQVVVVEPSAGGIPPAPIAPAPAPTPVPEEAAPSPPPVEARPAPAPTPVVPSPAPAPTAGPVSASAFAGWLGTKPQWARAAAIEAGLADDGYLKGWEAGAPVGHATRVSWYAASAYCESRGGLAQLGEPPLRWAEADGPYMELRQVEGQPAWRSRDGRPSEQIDPTQTAFATGFRCARP